MFTEDFLRTLLPKENELEDLFDELWPICRSLTGNGVRSSFEIIRKHIPLELTEVPSGTLAFDWKVPKEWNIDEAYIEDASGHRVVDFKDNNLHIVSYSVPVERILSLDDLQAHLFSLPDQPTAIPYVTSYYQDRWGFCLEHNRRLALKPGNYRVVIKSNLSQGALTYGETLLPSTVPGNTDEFLLSTYICHPSMANNELSGPLVSTFIYKALSKLKARRFNYRFVFVPETIGAITMLSRNGEHLKQRCKGGLVVTCCGDGNAVTYKRSKIGNSKIDRVVENILKHESYPNTSVRDFFPTGSDERQYCSPGFNLPVGSLIRSLYGEYPEYHTSLDNKDFISFKEMNNTIILYLKSLLAFERSGPYTNLSPNCEPMLGKRNLYANVGAQKSMAEAQKAYLYLLSYSDGKHDLITIADRMNISAFDLIKYADHLIEADLLRLTI